MNTFTIFNAKVLLSAMAAFAPMTLLLTGMEAATQQAVEQAQNQTRTQYQVPASAQAAATHGVVVG